MRFEKLVEQPRLGGDCPARRQVHGPGPGRGLTDGRRGGPALRELPLLPRVPVYAGEDLLLPLHHEAGPSTCIM